MTDSESSSDIVSSLPSFDELARRFDTLITRLERVDIRVPEDSALIGIASDLVPTVTHLLRRGIELLDDVELRYQGGSTEVAKSDDADTLQHIGLMISTELAARDLSDVAYFARAELRAAHERLVDTETRYGNRIEGQLVLASSCESSLHALRKALVSVESALYEFEETQAPKRQWFDVEISLQIRKLYWNLRRETQRADSHPDDLEQQLRRVLYRIVAFRELSVYPFLRFDDRVYLRQLLKRILDWLNSERRDQQTGSQIWQDLSSFTELLVQVSHRQELRDHDRELLGRAAHRIEHFPGRQLPPELLREMRALLGLDEALDELIESEVRDTAAWRGPLETTRAQLSRRGPVAHRADLGDLWSDA
ncbi:MAG: hypothetical protein AAGC60_10790 [Acidobacteriota bacterium]